MGYRNTMWSLLLVQVALLLAVYGNLDALDKENLIESPEKRAPSNQIGFQGMRGKKDQSYSYSDLDKRYGNRQNTMGFQGMRGKKSDSDILDKRAPNMMGFQGMRGKKEDQDLTNLDASLDKRDGSRNVMGFQGMRGKKFDQEIDNMNEYLLTSNKRAPSMMGFQGMRGKKDYLDNELEYLEKRAQMMGFQGMRGKKDNYVDELEYLDKRAPAMMGFQGMRGKKGDDAAYYLKRRGPTNSMGFVGARGKKDQEAGAPSSSWPFLNQIPIDFDKRRSGSVGFIGSRGKKEDEQNNNEFYQGLPDENQIEGGDFDEQALADQLRFEELIDTEKRAPNVMGFQGSRGKRGPFSLLGYRGKKGLASWFYNLRGKKIPSSMGFIGSRGKKSEFDSLLSDLNAGDNPPAAATDAVSASERVSSGMSSPNLVVVPSSM